MAVLPAIVIVGKVTDFGHRYELFIDDCSTLKRTDIDVYRPSAGVFIFRFKSAQNGFSVFLTTDGRTRRGTSILHTDASPIVRKVDDFGFEVNTIRYTGETETGYSNVNSGFKFIIVQGAGIGLTGNGTEGPPPHIQEEDNPDNSQ